MIVLIDNYDSFSYNVYQLAGAIEPDIRVVRNDSVTAEEIESMEPDAIILSPGPGRPSQAGICEEVIRRMGSHISILGICLGHQAICEVYGARITYAGRLMHGKQSEILTDRNCLLFQGIGESMQAARYHSLAAAPGSLPECLKVTAVSREGEIMAVQHVTYPVYGVQFHPESVMTPEGNKIMENFYRTAKCEKNF